MWRWLMQLFRRESKPAPRLPTLLRLQRAVAFTLVDSDLHSTAACLPSGLEVTHEVATVFHAVTNARVR